MKRIRTKKIGMFLLTLMMIIGISMSFDFGIQKVYALDCPFEGMGTETDPYIIDSASDLIWLSDNFENVSSFYFKQIADIDMSGQTFKPIGYKQVVGSILEGTYDGGGRKISNLTINSENSNLISVGLFCRIECFAVVKNLTLENANIKGGSITQAIGGIVGLSNAKVENCSVVGSSTIEGGTGVCCVGGIVGENVGAYYSGIISNCFNTGIVKSNSSNTNIGGIVGFNNFNSGNVGKAQVKNCYFSGTLTGTSSSNRGAIIGKNISDANVIVSDNYYLNTSAPYGIGSSSSNVGAASTVAANMKKASTFANWDFNTIWYINENNDYPLLRALAPPPEKIKVRIVNDGTNDNVIVSGLTTGDIFKIYSDANGGSPIASTTIAAGQTSATVNIGKLIGPTGSVHVSNTTIVRPESSRTKKNYKIFSIPITEGFENSGDIPIQWETTGVVKGEMGYDYPKWIFVKNSDTPKASPNTENYMAKVDCTNSDGHTRFSMDGDVPLENDKSYQFSFYMYHDTNDNTYGHTETEEKVQPQISIDGGSNWIDLGSPINRKSNSEGWAKHQLDISAYKGKNIRVGLLAISTYEWNMYIDDIEVNTVEQHPIVITAGKGLGRPDKKSAYSNVKIPFVIDSESFGKNLNAYSFDVIYDPTKVGTVTVDSFNGLAKPTIGTPTAEGSKEKVTVSWSGTFSGDLTSLYNNSKGVLFKLNFVVKPAFTSGETAVEVGSGSFTFAKGGATTDIKQNNGKILFGIYGDINCDGAITSTDTGLINKYTSGKTSAISGEVKETAADVNEDGVINSADGTEISNYISGKASTLKSLFGY